MTRAVRGTVFVIAADSENVRKLLATGLLIR